MRVLVTGSRGFIGTHLRIKLPRTDVELCGFDIKDSAEYDITNSSAVDDFWKDKKPDVVVHLAANPRVDLAQKYPLWENEVNVGGTINVLNASLRNKVSLFIYASTCLVYEVGGWLPYSESSPCMPRNPYEIDKYAGEFYCRNFVSRGLNVCILRFFNVYGPWQSMGYVIPDLMKRVWDSEVTVDVLGPSDDSRDFVHAADVAEAIVKTITLGFSGEFSGEIFNIGSGTETSIGDLCEIIAGVFGKNIRFNYRERPPGRNLGRYQADVLKAKTLLGWEPRIDLAKGIRFLIPTIYEL